MNILQAIREFNNRYPEHSGYITLKLYDDGSGGFVGSGGNLTLADVYLNLETKKLIVWETNATVSIEYCLD